MINNKIYEYCKDYLQKEEVKNEIIHIIKPFLGAFLNELHPYILFILVFALFSFLLLLSILYNLLRLKQLVLNNSVLKDKVYNDIFVI